MNREDLGKRLRLAISDPGHVVVRGGLVKSGQSVEYAPGCGPGDLQSVPDWQMAAVLAVLDQVGCPVPMTPEGPPCLRGFAHDGDAHWAHHDTVSWTYTACWAPIDQNGAECRCIEPLGHREHRRPL